MYPNFYPWYNIKRAIKNPDFNAIMGEASAAYDKSQTDMQTQEEKDKKVNKDSMVVGYVPHHNHGSVNCTSLVNDHAHQFLDVTFPPTPSENGTHVHFTEGHVVFEGGHTHYYKACSGPAIPVGDGMHVHYYDFYTTEDYGHRHHIALVNMPAPGTL